MRLLHFDDGRLLSTYFSDEDVPPYAILSHRWGESEVLLEHVEDGSYGNYQGYRKIEFCAQQAAKDQLQYFWIDTCCIDKWNLVELSTAINSMFSWYKNARKCYVFLPDVTAVDEQEDWKISLRESEWFRRGWTLQELIAPESVEFFSLEGKYLGDKKSLAQLIHEVTEIPIKALHGFAPNEFTISERIGWVKRRKTTEEEDIVYCILGIVGIYMSASYGEGRDKAWSRLELEMDGGSPFIVPFPRNPNFVGHEPQLDELQAILFGGKGTTKMAIVGPGGTGKSQLALEFAHRTREHDKNHSVFWVDSSSMDSIHQSYASIARKLGFRAWNSEKADIAQLLTHLSDQSADRSLFIFDHAEDEKILESLIDYVPRSDLCSNLFTTTSDDAAKTLGSQSTIKLQEMTPSLAQRMLEQYLNFSLSSDDRSESELLLQDLSHLPLAILQATAYINTRNITLEEYRSRLARQSRDSFQIKENGIENSMAVTILSLCQIRDEDPLAGEYLSMAACMNPQDILLEFFEAPTPKQREEAIKVIETYRLITRRTAESSLDLHQMVHRAIRDWLHNQDMLEEWIERAIARLKKVFPGDQHVNRSKWRRMMPHARYTLSHSPRSQEGMHKRLLMWKCALALLNDGQYGESEELLVQLLQVEVDLLGDEHPDTLKCMYILGSVYWNQGRLIESESLNLQLLQARKRVLGNEHPDTLKTMSNLASTYWSQRRLKEAEILDLQVMEIRERVFGKEDPHTLSSMHSVASTYSRQGRWSEAEELFLQLLDVQKRVMGNEHPDTLNTMNNLTSTYRYQHRWEDAENMAIRLIEMSKRICGDEHPDTLTAKSNLSSTYFMQNLFEEAEKLQVETMEASKKVVGDKHPLTLIQMNNLAHTWKGRGFTERAFMLLEDCYKLRVLVLGLEHPNTISTGGHLAEWRGENAQIGEQNDS